MCEEFINLMFFFLLSCVQSDLLEILLEIHVCRLFDFVANIFPQFNR
jgi:hypothetical protein